MPHANIWIKKENEEFWQNLIDKSSFVNEALRLRQSTKGTSKITNEEILAAQKALLEAPVPTENRKILGLPCCQKAKRCQHWQWNADDGVYVNTLSGEVAEADGF